MSKTKNKSVKRVSKKEAAAEAAREEIRERLHTLEKAAEAAREAVYSATLAYLLERWKVRGLGNEGVIVAPKSWYTGPEEFKANGLLKFTGKLLGHVLVQTSPTESVSALLDTKDQSSEVREFLHIHQTELAILGAVPIWQ